MTLLNLKNYCSLFFSRLKNLSSWAISNLFIFLITLLRPLLGPSGICPFEFGCTQFAILQLQTKPLHISLPAIFKRLVSCNPVSIWLKNKKTTKSS